MEVLAGNHVLFDVSDLDLPNASSVIAVRRGDVTGKRAMIQALVDTMFDHYACPATQPTGPEAASIIPAPQLTTPAR